MGYIKDMGCTSVSIHMGFWDIDNYSYYLSNYIDSMVADATSQGLYIMLRGFVMSGYPLDCDSCHYSTADWLSMWDTIANRYKGYNNIIYEPIGEYIYWDGQTYSNNIRSCIDIIRTHSPNAVVCVHGGNIGWANFFSFQRNYPVNRDNIMFSCDVYGFHTYPTNDQNGIYNALSSYNDFPAVSGFPLCFNEFGGGYNDQGGGGYNSWEATWVQNFMATMDAHGAAGYHAFTWEPESWPPCALVSDWSGHLTAFGNDIKAYYLSN